MRKSIIITKINTSLSLSLSPLYLRNWKIIYLLQIGNFENTWLRNLEITIYNKHQNHKQNWTLNHTKSTITHTPPLPDLHSFLGKVTRQYLPLYLIFDLSSAIHSDRLHYLSQTSPTSRINHIGFMCVDAIFSSSVVICYTTTCHKWLHN